METVLDNAKDAREVAMQDVAGSVGELGGKYLTFLLDDEEYGLEILKVREIMGIMDITKVPQTPDFAQGVVNLRGKVIPVIDLRTKFGLQRTDYNDQTCVIVVDVGMLMGIIVDTVQEVHDVKILLDIDKVLTSDELVQLREATDTEGTR